MESSAEETAFSYKVTWDRLCSKTTCEELKTLAYEFNLNADFRTIYWKIFLGFFRQHDIENWIKQTHLSRERYNELTQNFQLNPHVTTDLKDNPLSQDKKSIWYRYLCDVELRNKITKDVLRTDPGNSFINDPMIITLMTNILFCYARQYSNICYRQGMNEILGNVLVAIKIDYDKYREAVSNEWIGGIISELMNPVYLEHDTYCLFELIMNNIKHLYETDEIVPNLTGEFPRNRIVCLDDSPVCVQLQIIRKNVLSVYDSQLDAHLRNLRIEFPVFGVRWLRLMFGREFNEETLYKIWDVIFAYNDQFVLIYYILIAMLICIRKQLLSSSYVDCMKCLLKFPQISNAQQMVSFALHIKEPNIFPPIDLAASTFVEEVNYVAEAKNYTYEEPIPSILSGKFGANDLTKRYRRVSTSSPYSHNRIIKGNRLIRSHLQSAATSDNSQKVRVELNQCKSIISLCKLQVEVVKGLLSAAKSPSSDTPVDEVISGLDQLSLMLDVNASKMPDPDTMVGTAKGPPESRPNSPLATTSPSSSASSSSSITHHMVALNLPPPRTDINMTVFSCTERQTDSSNFPSENPLHSFKSIFNKRSF